VDHRLTGISPSQGTLVTAPNIRKFIMLGQ